MNLKNKILLSFFFGLTSLFSLQAETFVAMATNAKVFDEPNAKGYITLNKNNEEVSPLAGMAFKVIEAKQGWFVVEYSPGLRGYISEQVTANKTVAPTPGTYTVKNQPKLKITASKEGDSWNATVAGKLYKGNDNNGIISFHDDNGNIAYTLINLDGNNVAMSYDNAVTKFF